MVYWGGKIQKQFVTNAKEGMTYFESIYKKKYENNLTMGCNRFQNYKSIDQKELQFFAAWLQKILSKPIFPSLELLKSQTKLPLAAVFNDNKDKIIRISLALK